jgi:predicted metal-dependent phosphoesterase TrpH
MNVNLSPCDLHIHSTFSDSDMTVEEIFQKAKGKGLQCIAVTDHDTIASAPQTQELSRRYGIECLIACELSAQEGDTEVHVLGYCVDPANEILREALKNVKEQRRERLGVMVDKLNVAGLAIAKEDVLSRVADTMATRLHLGLYLLEKRKVSSLRDAFRKYLAPGKAAYVSRFKYSVQETVALIKNAGGLSFLAHPHMLTDQSWIEKFISYGLNGLEIMYPGMSETKRLIYSNMIKKYKLLRSGGSDAHGRYKEFTQVGSVTVPYEWVEEIKNARS